MVIFTGITFYINKQMFLHKFYVISIGRFISGSVNGFIYFTIINQTSELYSKYTQKVMILMLPFVVTLSSILYALALNYYFLNDFLYGYDSMIIGLISLYMIPYFCKESLISLICNNNQSEALKYFAKFNDQSKSDENVKQNYEQFKNHVIKENSKTNNICSKKFLYSFYVVCCARFLHVLQSNALIQVLLFLNIMQVFHNEHKFVINSISLALIVFHSICLFGGILQKIKNRKYVKIIVMSVTVITILSAIFSFEIFDIPVSIGFLCISFKIEMNSLEKSMLKLDFPKRSWSLACIGILENVAHVIMIVTSVEIMKYVDFVPSIFIPVGICMLITTIISF